MLPLVDKDIWMTCNALERRNHCDRKHMGTVWYQEVFAELPSGLGYRFERLQRALIRLTRPKKLLSSSFLLT